MFGYKVFNFDMTCRDFQYEVGNTYVHDGPIELCEAGFHFCKDVIDCFNYYYFDFDNRVCTIETMGEIIESKDDSKCVTNKIKIVEELSWNKVLELTNIGKGNTGLKNTGEYNTGYDNPGNGNTGDKNTGHWNTGVGNPGKWNTGNCNPGDRNSGDFNSGDFNSGRYNAGNHFSGFFCTGEAKMMLFNKPTEMTFDEIINRLPSIQIDVTKWISENDMTKREKEDYSEYETIGGYIKEIPYKEAWINWWTSASKKDKKAIKNLPNFDAKIFLEITGIDIKEMK